ncbi:hypothetical protein MXB_2713 [Myxobolus squamalis]|nr:hypothetical protein MXB_2713 [Myxobolus squamalis]
MELKQYRQNRSPELIYGGKDDNEIYQKVLQSFETPLVVPIPVLVVSIINYPRKDFDLEIKILQTFDTDMKVTESVIYQKLRQQIQSAVHLTILI